MTDRSKLQQLLLRVKPHSELDKLVRGLLDAKRPLTEDELRDIGGLRRSGVLVRWLDKWFDNVRVNVERGDPNKACALHYVDIMPGAPQAVGVDVVKVEGVKEGKREEHREVDEIRWPQAPPLIEEMENFRKPTWFDTMQTMTRLGSHTSLSGPPGVGKDTAVQQLACQEGRPLVTVSGDGGFRRRDLVGTVELSGGSSFFNVVEYAAAVINGWWALITEVNAADADALLFINSQLAPPYVINIHGKAYPVHPEFRLFVSYNPGLIGTKPLPPAFKDRFFPVKMFFFSEVQLRDRLEAWGLPGTQDEVDVDSARESIQNGSIIVEFGVGMWQAHEDGKMRYQISVRRLIDTITLLNNKVVSDVWQALKLAVISTIDSNIEAKAAEQVMRSVRDQYNIYGRLDG